MGFGFRFELCGEDLDPAQLNKALSERGLAAYEDEPSRIEAADRQCRCAETGIHRLTRLVDLAARTLGKELLIGRCSALVPRAFGDVMLLSNGFPVGDLEQAWEEWLLVGDLVGLDGRLGVDDALAVRIDDEEDLEQDDDMERVEMRHAWFCFYEAMRLAREHGLAFRLV